MRISTSQIYDSGIRGMQRAQSAVYKSQNQISADTRLLTASDDPIAAAQAVVAAQAKAINEQSQTNQGSAANQLALVDSHLSSVTDLLQTVRNSLVKASNTGVLSSSDRESIATELESNVTELLGQANSTDELGDYMFSGYQGGTLPFARDAAGTVAYSGDAGERLLQVSTSRQIAVNASGYDVFMDGKTGNGSFVASTGYRVDTSTTPPTQLVGADGGAIVNQGTATIDRGSVLNRQTWTAAANNANASLPLTIAFSTDASGALGYQIADAVGGTTGWQSYTSGQAISLVSAYPVDFGSQVVVSGTPVAGDTFSIAASTTQSVFQTIQDAITALRQGLETTSDPVTSPATYTATQQANDLAGILTNLDLAMENVGTAQAKIGASAKEVDSLAGTSADLAIQYKATLSDLQDLDYVEAYSNYTKQQTTLQAAQQSFTKISGKSLFDYL